MTRSKPKFEHIVITGASSGIGEALAIHYARKGVRLGLIGRDNARLMSVSNKCRERGAEVVEQIIDVTDRAAMERWLHEIDAQKPIDLLIANAGISAGMGGSGEKASQVRRLFDVNVNGVLNTIEPILPRMIERKKGHIALMSSLAGFRGWPGAPAYCATKAAVKSYGEGLRGALADTGVKIHVICPGFVRSRITDANKFIMPFFMEAPRAAEIISCGIDNDKGRIAFPWPAYVLMWICGSLPDFVASAVLRRMPAKAAQ